MTYSADLVARSALIDAAAEIGGGKETPPGSNHTTYWAEVYPAANGPGMNWAWCAGFQSALYLRQGCDLRKVVSNPFYCPSIEGWARSRGFWTASPRPGDLVLYGVAGQESPHIGQFERWSGGYVQAIEGNTSPGTAGSQDDGGGVYRRLRPTSWVHGFVDMRAAIDHYAAAGVWAPVDGLARQREMRDAGIPVEADGLYGPDSQEHWRLYMSEIADLKTTVAELSRAVAALAKIVGEVRRAVTVPLDDRTKVAVGGKPGDEMPIGTLMAPLVRRVTATNTVLGDAYPELDAAYDAAVAAAVERGDAK